jgi:NADPH:quinone reductase-like Zn-dependent oxidoreductase
MKAIVYDKKGRFTPEQLVLRDIPKPVPSDTELLVKVCAVGLNAADYRSAQMGLRPEHGILGADIAGRVEAVGAKIAGFRPGDEVAGDLSGYGFGGLAEYALAPERLLARKPTGVSFITAAAIPMAAVTALQGLRDLGGIQPGNRVLIYGSGGGVGSFAIQLAKHFGAEVTAVCGPGNAALSGSLGADRVSDYTREDILRSGAQFDLVLAVNGNQPPGVYRRVLAPHGRCVMAGGALGQIIPFMLFGWLLSLGGKTLRMLAAKPSAADLAFVLGLVETGQLKAIIDREYPLEDTPAAFRYLVQGHVRGKVVITLNAAPE